MQVVVKKDKPRDTKEKSYIYGNKYLQRETVSSKNIVLVIE